MQKTWKEQWKCIARKDSSSFRHNSLKPQKVRSGFSFNRDCDAVHPQVLLTFLADLLAKKFSLDTFPWLNIASNFIIYPVRFVWSLLASSTRLFSYLNNRLRNRSLAALSQTRFDFLRRMDENVSNSSGEVSVGSSSASPSESDDSKKDASDLELVKSRKGTVNFYDISLFMIFLFFLNMTRKTKVHKRRNNQKAIKTVM